MRQLERDQPVGSSLDALVHPDGDWGGHAPLRLATVAQPVRARSSAASRAGADPDDLWELAAMLGFSAPEGAPARRAAAESGPDPMRGPARARFAWDENPARLLATDAGSDVEAGLARRAMPTVAPSPSAVTTTARDARPLPLTHTRDADAELACLREELALKERQLGELEAAAVAAWDDTVPRLEQRIASLIEANRRLKERLNQIPASRVEPGLAVNVAG